MSTLVIVLLIIAVPVAFSYVFRKDKWRKPTESFPKEWRAILTKKVSFYNALSKEEMIHFETRVHEFILNHRITGISTDIDITDQVLVAASAIIPVFRFPHWKYANLYEVLIYPNPFNDNFETAGKERSILGMVGTGYMNGKMILSKPALYHGFASQSDKKNTAIHEFAHLIDGLDGSIDGIPKALIENESAAPWISLIQRKMNEIYEEKSDINPYGGTSEVEFFAVASEYFFENPKVMEKKHPQLYRFLEGAFDHDMAERSLKRKRVRIGRNEPCPCKSGKKFKRCCGSPHYT